MKIVNILLKLHPFILYWNHLENQYILCYGNKFQCIILVHQFLRTKLHKQMFLFDKLLRIYFHRK